MGAMSDAVMDAVLMATRVCLGAKAKAEGERRGDITAKSQVVLSAVVGQTQRKAPIAIRRKGFGLPKGKAPACWRPRDTERDIDILFTPLPHKRRVPRTRDRRARTHVGRRNNYLDKYKYKSMFSPESHLWRASPRASF